ncbi:MAG TPA: zinc ribbon domain-containing protein [Solirubrobacteraceae bacterium]|jgi:hypothetical protein|nr:zinc ribbon domain-containing protein [Solirubrobacteraceae bacterium]
MRACANCGASIADDQRYCLECGGRQVQARSEFLNRFTPAAVGPAAAPAGIQAAPPASGRSMNATTVAGVGVLLLAMGVGVLIGRAGAGKTSATPPAQVISVASAGADSGAGAGAGTSAAGTGASGAAGSATASEIPEDWPAGKSAYAVQLQTFSTSAAQASEVAAAKSAALGKGATAVGILLSSNFTSLPADQYVVYSGDYSSEASAKHALGSLKAKFPAASVIHVSGDSASSSAAAGGASSSKSAGGGSSGSSPAGGGGLKPGGGAGRSSPAPSSGSSSSGQSYEQKSRNLPNVVVTG